MAPLDGFTGVVVMPANDRARAREAAHAKGAYPAPANEGRSRNMRANRRRDTKPELALRSSLHRLGYRYRKDYRLSLDDGIRVKPDIVFTARRVAIFVDGCFWHACPEHGRQPTSNEWYWAPKLARNVERDRTVTAALERAGWAVLRIWEHEQLATALELAIAAIEHASDTSRAD
ncbi:very short patch repair endonuclease [Saccharopolyspora sp. 6T]|uniref:very short patch repair endonuclease n=1 Tax=Saccharopolyspora sp. 6T TaxID=2877238 RepID=UPI001CD405E1|nr:very short patch repair endonuclease [Saccharopolyspora sp. 6T]MCA1185210.1 very short patch repair endonuclease [Saccharopolyspora sp. 6T]